MFPRRKNLYLHDFLHCAVAFCSMIFFAFYVAYFLILLEINSWPCVSKLCLDRDLLASGAADRCGF